MDKSQEAKQLMARRLESLAGLLCFERKCVLEREEKAAGINKTPFLMLVGLLTC